MQMRLQSSTSETRVGRTEHPITPELKEILEALGLQKPPLPIAALHRQLYRIAIERGQPEI